MCCSGWKLPSLHAGREKSSFSAQTLDAFAHQQFILKNPRPGIALINRPRWQPAVALRPPVVC